MNNFFQFPVSAPTHEYRLISDGNGCAVVWRILNGAKTALGNPKPGTLHVTEYFSKLPPALQQDNLIREHMGQDKI